jgi:DNA-binding CsgD family transcriptional regulator
VRACSCYLPMREMDVSPELAGYALRRFSQANALYLQAYSWPVIYSSVMSPVDGMLALTSDQDAAQALPDLANGAAGAFRSDVPGRIRRMIVRSRSALINMRLDEAKRITLQLESLLSNCSLSQAAHYASALGMLQASILVAKDDVIAAGNMLMTLPSLRHDALVATLLRYTDWKCGRHPEACTPDTVDYLVVPVGGKAVYRILSLCVSAVLAFDRLQLTVCANLAIEALELAKLRYGNHSAMNSFPATLLAQVAYEQGRIEEAEALLRPRIAVIRASGMPECVARASVLLARLRLHRGQHRGALATLRETEALGRARGWPTLISLASTEYARILQLIRYNEADSAESGSQSRRYTRFITNLRIQARFALPLRLRHLLTRPAVDALPSEELLRFPAVETALRRVCSAVSDGSPNEGYDLLIRCLRIGAARGLRMVFADAGQPMLALLEGLYYALPADDAQLLDLRPYVATLLRSAVQANSADPSPVPRRPLSRRETGILQMIANGMSNKQIAQALGITPETVKSHAKRIFVKLSSHTRAQAVARAEAFGLL